MPVLVTNNTGKDYILPNRLLIPDGESVVLVDHELEWIPLEKRDAALLAVTALPVDVAVATAKYDVKIDEVSPTLSYIGEAAADSATSAPVWRITRLFESGTITSVTHADGVDTYTKVWDDRASYSY